MMFQYLANGLCAGSVFALVGLSFSLIYRPCRFFHFAHGAVLISAPYIAYLLARTLGWPMSVGVCLALGLASTLGAGLYWLIYRPMRRRGATDLVLLLASLGLYIVLQNIFSLVFGTDTKNLSGPSIDRAILIGSALLVPIQLTTLCVSVVACVATALVLAKTRAGRRYRAIVGDRQLAMTDGIDADKLQLWAFALGSGLAGGAGLLIALDIGVAPTMGLNALMMGIVALIVGGIESVAGVLLGGVLLGMVQGLATWKIGSQWQEAVAFGLLLFVLILRPQGLLTRRTRDV